MFFFVGLATKRAAILFFGKFLQRAKTARGHFKEEKAKSFQNVESARHVTCENYSSNKGPFIGVYCDAI